MKTSPAVRAILGAMDQRASAPTCHHGRIRVASERSIEFIDVTSAIETLAAQVGIQSGLVHVQSLHATTAIVVDDCEPLRLSDVDALLPAPSASMSLADGRVQLGREQRVFLVEFDGPRVREVSVIVLPAPAASSSSDRFPIAG